jgi:putative redox protein
MRAAAARLTLPTEQHDPRRTEIMAQKKAIIRQLQGITFAAKSDSNHWVMMDGSPAFGGSSAGSSPKELVLMALGGCTASDVVSILGKKRAPVSNVEVRLTANVTEEHPQVFTDIHIEYVIYGDGVKAEDVERAIELSTTKYCAVSMMLRPAMKITHSHSIQPAVPAANATVEAR